MNTNERILVIFMIVMAIGFVLSVVYHDEINEWSLRTHDQLYGEESK